MIRWLFVIFLVLVVFSAALPWLEKLGIGRLPGDFRFTFLGRRFHFPFASTVLIALCILALGKLL